MSRGEAPRRYVLPIRTKKNGWSFIVGLTVCQGTIRIRAWTQLIGADENGIGGKRLVASIAKFYSYANHHNHNSQRLCKQRKNSSRKSSKNPCNSLPKTQWQTKMVFLGPQNSNKKMCGAVTLKTFGDGLLVIMPSRSEVRR